MANRKKCNQCNRFVGGGVLHEKDCQERGSVVVEEQLNYKCDECDKIVGFVKDVDKKAVYHSSECNMKGEVENYLLIQKD